MVEEPLDTPVATPVPASIVTKPLFEDHAPPPSPLLVTVTAPNVFVLASTVISWLMDTSPDVGGTTPPPQHAVLLQLLLLPDVA